VIFLISASQVTRINWVTGYGQPKENLKGNFSRLLFSRGLGGGGGRAEAEVLVGNFAAAVSCHWGRRWAQIVHLFVPGASVLWPGAGNWGPSEKGDSSTSELRWVWDAPG
jgi:hypothetical protein